MVQSRDEGRRRGATMVRLKMSDGQIHGIKFTTPPSQVQGNLINILAGETLYIEVLCSHVRVGPSQLFEIVNELLNNDPLFGLRKAFLSPKISF
jgi:hypothetical protein